MSRRLIELDPALYLSVSATTRPARKGEGDGRDYSFVTDEQFDDLIRRNALLEWAEVFGHRYGTPAGPIEEAVSKGLDAVLEIDVQGARKVRDKVPGAVLVFLVPPTREELARRLRERGTEDVAELESRLDAAGRDMAEAGAFDHVVENDDVERATREVAAIIEERRRRRAGHEGDPR